MSGSREDSILDIDGESIETLNTILAAYNQRLSQAKKDTCMRVSTNQWCPVFFIPPAFLTVVLLGIYGLMSMKSNAIENACPDFDFQNNCNLTGINNTLGNCSTSLINDWCSMKDDIPQTLRGGIITAEIFAAVVLIYAFVLLCKNYSVTVQLTQDEVDKITEIHAQEVQEIDMKETDLAANPAGAIKKLIKAIEKNQPKGRESLYGEGLGTMFSSSNNTAHLQSTFLGETVQPSGCWDSLKRRFTRR